MLQERHVELAKLICTRLDIVYQAVDCHESRRGDDCQTGVAALRSRVTCSSLETETMLRVELLGIRETAMPTSRRLPGLVRWTIVNTQESANLMHITLVFAGSAPAWHQDATAQVISLLRDAQEAPCPLANVDSERDKPVCEPMPVVEGTPLANEVEALLFSRRHSSTLPASLKVVRRQDEVVALYIDVLTESIEAVHVCMNNPGALRDTRVKIEAPMLNGLVMSVELGPALSRCLVAKSNVGTPACPTLCIAHQNAPIMSWRQITIVPIIEAVTGVVRCVRRAARRKELRALTARPY